MAIYYMMFGMVIIFMVQSYGHGQMVKHRITCDTFSTYAYYNCTGHLGYFQAGCDPYHVILITNVTMGYYNETEEQTCCQRMPDNICTVEANTSSYLRYIYHYISSCTLSYTCYTYLDSYYYEYYHYGFRRNDNCSLTNLLVYTEYKCISNSSIINMTKPGISHNLESFSLAYNSDRYPEIDNHFYCSCEIKADDDDDVFIYTTVLYLRLIEIYNTSVTIYSRDYTVRYDANNTDMTRVDRWGYRYLIYKQYKYLIYKQLKQTRGPIHLVYEGGNLLSNNDQRVWIDFKAFKGRLSVNCTGCQKGYSIPPTFNGPSAVQTTGTMGSTSSGPQTSSSDIYKYALISVLVIIAVLGLVMMGVVIYKKRKCTKDKMETAKDIPTTSEPASDIPTVSETVSDIPRVSEEGSEMYDPMEMNNQPDDVYESLEPDTIYEMC